MWENSMRYFLIGILVIMASCTSKEEKAAQVAARAAFVSSMENTFDRRVSILVNCKKAANRHVREKPQQCTKTRSVVVGSKLADSTEYCFPPDMYGNQFCHTDQTTEPVYGSQTYQGTCDANLEKREDFVAACECKNKLYSEPVKGKISSSISISQSDLKYSLDYLQERARIKYISYNTVRKFDPKKLLDGDYDKGQCDAKQQYYRKQSWYKRIPVVK